MKHVMPSASTMARQTEAPSVFLVLVQDPETRGYRRLGRLRRDEDGYAFSYDARVRSALLSGDLRPLIEFPDVDKVYRGQHLFSTFANRVMTPRRDSYRDYYVRLGFEAPPEPFEVLARTLGSKATDHVQLLPVPEVSDEGVLSFYFLLHGGRHVDPDCAKLQLVAEGAALYLAPEDDNPSSSVAVLVGSEPAPTRGSALGYVPDPLAAFVRRVLAEALELSVTAAHVNPPSDAGGRLHDHMRMLVHVVALVREDFDPEALLVQE